MSTISIEKIMQVSALNFISGPQENYAHAASEPNQNTNLAGKLCFANTLHLAEIAIANLCSILIIDKKINLSLLPKTTSTSILQTSHIPMTMTQILPLFRESSGTASIHKTAQIAENAIIGANVEIGAYVVIGENCKIGDNSKIGHHSVLEHSSIIGNNTILHSHVFVGWNCVVGNNCEIFPFACLGADGFGFVPNSLGQHQKIPQLGNVIIEDRVEIGAHCAIDRATLSETRIGEGSKFDNFCHIAHNCRIGKNNVFAGGFMMAGSSTIGNNCMFGGGTLVTDHVQVGDNIIVGGKSGITKDLMEPGAYTGYPLEPFKDGLKTLINLTKLTELRKDIASLKKLTAELAEKRN